MESLFLLAKEGQSKSILDDYHAQRQATSRYLLGAISLSDPVLDVIRRELRRAFPDVRVEADDLKRELIEEVFKREVTEGEKAEEARRRIARAQGRSLRAKGKAVSGDGSEAEVTIAPIEETTTGQ